MRILFTKIFSKINLFSKFYPFLDINILPVKLKINLISHELKVSNIYIYIYIHIIEIYEKVDYKIRTQIFKKKNNHCFMNLFYLLEATQGQNKVVLCL